MTRIQFPSSSVKWVKDVKNETHQLLGEFRKEGKERAAFVKQNASAVNLFLNESEKDRLSTARENMAAIKSRFQHIRQEEKEIIKNAHEIMHRITEENKELAGGVKRFLTHSETERLADYKKMMEGLHQSIGELRERTEEIRRESIKLLKQLGGENGTLRTEIKKFLRESEETRIRDFKKMMHEVQAVVGEIQPYKAEERGLARADTKEVSAVGEIQPYEAEERRLAGAGDTKEVSGDVVKKKEITHEVKPEKKAVEEGRSRVEAERKKLMPACSKCGIRHWPFQKCPGGKSSFKKKKIT